MDRRLLVAAAMLTAAVSAHAQWQMQDSHSTAGLRGVHSVDGTVAWASGTQGTVLRTIDGGAHWEKCAVPPGAEKLDFRAVWAWDGSNALVMSAGPGELSRLYETTDACAHWTEQIRSPDKDGFWDALAFPSPPFSAPGNVRNGVLVGDPIQGHFDTRMTATGKDWTVDGAACASQPGEGAFAASNSSVVVFGSLGYMIGTGGKEGPRLLISPSLAHRVTAKGCGAVKVPLAAGTESAGIFSVAFRDRKHGMVVGGDYRKPAESAGTAAWTSDGGLHWTAASKPPHGFRSSVAWFHGLKAWIAAGTNGSDISRDGGKTWQPLDNGDWNALSPPFIVGPKGRIAKLAPSALKR